MRTDVDPVQRPEQLRFGLAGRTTDERERIASRDDGVDWFLNEARRFYGR